MYLSNLQVTITYLHLSNFTKIYVHFLQCVSELEKIICS